MITLKKTIFWTSLVFLPGCTPTLDQVIKNHDLAIGMNWNEVTRSIGWPDKIEPGKEIERWHYKGMEKQMVFRNGILIWYQQ